MDEEFDEDADYDPIEDLSAAARRRVLVRNDAYAGRAHGEAGMEVLEASCIYMPLRMRMGLAMWQCIRHL